MIPATVDRAAGLGSITCRPAEPSDRAFLRRLYGTTREDELIATGWPAEQRASFIEQQFNAQGAYYRDVYPAGRFEVVLLDGDPIGRCYVAQLADEIRLIDVTLLPAVRDRGIGTALLGMLCAQADAAGLPIRLHVEPWNPARRLYGRFGFRTLEVRSIHEFMERPPANSLVNADESPQGG